MTHFADRLAEAVRTAGNPLCLGLDPRWESLPRAVRDRFRDGTLAGVAAAFESFSLRVLDLARGRVPAVKPQSAFYETCGPAGLAALQATIARARELGFVTILDSKRGDIATTATAYADAAFGGTLIDGAFLTAWDADALTVNPYLGRDAIEPFIQSARRSGRGLFVLVRTSNPGAGLFQDAVGDGLKLHERVADAVADWNGTNLAACGLGDVGAVVGATNPAELAALRKRMPNVWLLVPGYGAQGGSAADVAGAFRLDGLGAVVNSSRAITFPFHPDDPAWEAAVVAALDRSAAELAAISRPASRPGGPST